MPIAWDADPPTSLGLIATNAAVVAGTIHRQAKRRERATLELALEWHRSMYAGVLLPIPYYAGEVRDSDPRFPELVGYDVLVGGLPGVRHTEVPAALAAFEQGMLATTDALDPVIAPGGVPATPDQLRAVIRLAALAHGEWVRIHPFANGNGRVARCWANFVALRFGLPAFVTIRPRPASLVYRQAAIASMAHDHGPTERLFAAMLQSAISTL